MEERVLSAEGRSIQLMGAHICMRPESPRNQSLGPGGGSVVEPFLYMGRSWDPSLHGETECDTLLPA